MSQNGDNESLHFHDLKTCGLGLSLRSLCQCTVCVKSNNDELFFNAFPFGIFLYFWIGLETCEVNIILEVPCM